MTRPVASAAGRLRPEPVPHEHAIDANRVAHGLEMTGLVRPAVDGLDRNLHDLAVDRVQERLELVVEAVRARLQVLEAQAERPPAKSGLRVLQIDARAEA